MVSYNSHHECYPDEAVISLVTQYQAGHELSENFAAQRLNFAINVTDTNHYGASYVPELTLTANPSADSSKKITPADIPQLPSIHFDFATDPRGNWHTASATAKAADLNLDVNVNPIPTLMTVPGEIRVEDKKTHHVGLFTAVRDEHGDFRGFKITQIDANGQVQNDGFLMLTQTGCSNHELHAAVWIPTLEDK